MRLWLRAAIGLSAASLIWANLGRFYPAIAAYFVGTTVTLTGTLEYDEMKDAKGPGLSDFPAMLILDKPINVKGHSSTGPYLGISKIQILERKPFEFKKYEGKHIRVTGILDFRDRKHE